MAGLLRAVTVMVAWVPTGVLEGTEITAERLSVLARTRTRESLLLQFRDRSVALEGSTMAVRVALPPGTTFWVMLTLDSLRRTPVTGEGGSSTVTVQIARRCGLATEVATMFAWPGARAVRLPFWSTETALELLLQVTSWLAVEGLTEANRALVWFTFKVSVVLFRVTLCTSVAEDTVTEQVSDRFEEAVEAAVMVTMPPGVLLGAVTRPL